MLRVAYGRDARGLRLNNVRAHCSERRSIVTAKMRARGIIGALGGRVFARAVGAALQAITLVVLARILSPSEFAPFALIPTVGAACACLLGGGLGTLALRVGGEQGWGVQLLRLAVVVSVQIGLVAAAVGVCLSSAGWLLVAAPSVMVAVDQLVGVAQGVLAGQTRHRDAARLLIAQRALPLCGLLFGGFIGGHQIAGYGLGGLILFIVVAAPIYRNVGALPTIRAVLSRAKGFWGVSAVSTLAYLDVLIVGLFLGEYAAGIYGATVRLVAPLSILTSSIIYIIVPEASRHYQGERARIFSEWRRYGRWTAFSLALLAPLMCWLGLLALGQDYAPGRWILLALMLGSALSLLSQITLAELFSMNREGVAATALGCAYMVGTSTLILIGATGSLGWLWVYPLVLQGLTWVMLGLQRNRNARSPATRADFDESRDGRDDSSV
jgi:O-antigen/teichoic acid export membrane protein